MTSVFIQCGNNKEDICCCSHCGACIGSVESIADAFISGVADKNADVVCKLGCGTAYCSDICRSFDFQLGHDLICFGHVQSEDHPLYTLKMLSYATGFYDQFSLGVKLVARLLSDMNWMSKIQSFPPWESIYPNYDIHESWNVLMAAIPSAASVVTVEIWSKIIGGCLCWSLQMSIENPLTLYLKGCRMSPDEIIKALWISVNTIDEGGMDDDENSSQEEVLTITQFIETPENFFEKITGLVLIGDDTLNGFSHSCIPRYNFKFVSGISFSLEETAFSKSEKTISLIPVNTEFSERQSLLLERGIVCRCARCNAESNVVKGLYPMIPLEFYKDLCILNEAFDLEVEDILNSILHYYPNSSWAIYKKARLLGWADQWAEANRLRSAFISNCKNPDDPEFMEKIKLNVEQQKFFVSKTQMDPHRIVDEFSEVRIGNSLVLMSKVPLLSKEECNTMIFAAEEYASLNNGWTTDRHYAVSTTDVPVAKLEKVHSLSKVLFCERIFPVLSLQHSIDVSSIRVIDAFLVKYDAAAGQCYLPLHVDESQFSITVALNGDFEGGGTYFLDIDTTLNPIVGGMVSFPGTLMHSGHPVTEGTRYIIAAFLYSE